eukprot:m.1488640 g.1488640  ORF g.1488640 m.1488640 type:complete len:71 (+) comp25188_c0_seq19:334-546(+)
MRMYGRSASHTTPPVLLANPALHVFHTMNFTKMPQGHAYILDDILVKFCEASASTIFGHVDVLFLRKIHF